MFSFSARYSAAVILPENSEPKIYFFDSYNVSWHQKQPPEFSMSKMVR